MVRECIWVEHAGGRTRVGVCNTGVAFRSFSEAPLAGVRERPVNHGITPLTARLAKKESAVQVLIMGRLLCADTSYRCHHAMPCSTPCTSTASTSLAPTPADPIPPNPPTYPTSSSPCPSRSKAPLRQTPGYHARPLRAECSGRGDTIRTGRPARDRTSGRGGICCRDFGSDA
jgi:hypothetical protein